MSREVSYENMKALEEENENLRARVVELEAWKESAQAVMNEIDLQAVGKELNVKLGEAIGPSILPALRALRALLKESEIKLWKAEHYLGDGFRQEVVAFRREITSTLRG